jgi:hypothetical protein
MNDNLNWAIIFILACEGTSLNTIQGSEEGPYSAPGRPGKGSGPDRGWSSWCFKRRKQNMSKKEALPPRGGLGWGLIFTQGLPTKGPHGRPQWALRAPYGSNRIQEGPHDELLLPNPRILTPSLLQTAVYFWCFWRSFDCQLFDHSDKEISKLGKKLCHGFESFTFWLLDDRTWFTLKFESIKVFFRKHFYKYLKFTKNSQFLTIKRRQFKSEFKKRDLNISWCEVLGQNRYI